MNKLVEYLLEVSFIALMVRCLICGANLGEAIIGISLVIAICYKHYYIIRNQINDKAILIDQLEQLKSAIISIKMGQNLTRKPYETIKEETTPIRRF